MAKRRPVLVDPEADTMTQSIIERGYLIDDNALYAPEDDGKVAYVIRGTCVEFSGYGGHVLTKLGKRNIDRLRAELRERTSVLAERRASWLAEVNAQRAALGKAPIAA